MLERRVTRNVGMTTETPFELRRRVGEDPYVYGTLSIRVPGAARHERRAERIGVSLPAGFRQRGGPGVFVEVRDLSTHGFRVQTHLDLAPGATVWLRLPGLEPRAATVAWIKGQSVGCAFDRPLFPRSSKPS